MKKIEKDILVKKSCAISEKFLELTEIYSDFEIKGKNGVSDVELIVCTGAMGSTAMRLVELINSDVAVVDMNEEECEVYGVEIISAKEIETIEKLSAEFLKTILLGNSLKIQEEFNQYMISVGNILHLKGFELSKELIKIKTLLKK